MRKILVVEPEEIEWEAVKELPEGAWIKMLSIDEETGAFSALFKSISMDLRFSVQRSCTTGGFVYGIGGGLNW